LVEIEAGFVTIADVDVYLDRRFVNCDELWRLFAPEDACD
jgi:hypothetical protein